MPTFEALVRFFRDYSRLDQDQRRAFAAARQAFVDVVWRRIGTHDIFRQP